MFNVLVIICCLYFLMCWLSGVGFCRSNCGLIVFVSGSMLIVKSFVVLVSLCILFGQVCCIIFFSNFFVIFGIG